MEKLRPLLTHMFWIVFGFAMILPTVGWWMDTAGVDAVTEAAIGANNTAFESVPSPDSPNASWEREMRKTRNVVLERDYKKYNRYLWETQRKEMDWPDSINAYMQDRPFEGEIDTSIRRNYRKEYFKELDAAWRVVDPLTNELPAGKVIFEPSNFSPQVGPGDWPMNPPDSQEMWEVQQDIWLLKALLSAIAKVNHEFENHLHAPINTILMIKLRGGNPAALKSLSTKKNAETAGAGLTDTNTPGRFGASGGFAGGSARSEESININLDQLFGPDTLQGKASGIASAAPGEDAGVFNAARGGGGRNRLRVRRYVDDEEGAPFKTRGFAVKVIMDHSRLPDLMTQLSNLEWPAEIVLVRQQIVNRDSLQAIGGGAGRQGIRGLGRRGAFMPRRVPLRAGAQRDDRNRNNDIADMKQAASAKMNLAVVTIAGKLTLFQPPPHEDEALAATDTVENGKQKTRETTDDTDAKAADSPEAAQNAADAPTEDPAATGSPASTPQPDSKAAQSKGADNLSNDSTPDNRVPAETNGPKPPATGTNKTDKSTTSPKDDRPE